MADEPSARQNCEFTDVSGQVPNLFMAEIFGAAAASAAMIETALRLVSRFRSANGRQKNLTEILDKHFLQLESLRTVVEAIVNEDALHTPAVGAELARLQAIGARLVICLRELDPRNNSRNRTRQLVHQLVNGTRDEGTLADIMTDLDRAKADLSLHLQYANTGLSHMVHHMVLTNAETVNRIEHLLSDNFDEGRHFKGAALVKNGITRGEEFASFEKADFASKSYETDNFFENTTIDRIIAGNSAEDFAVQLLGPAGKDLWEDCSVQIKNNTAKGLAIQIGYPTTTNTLEGLLEHQERMAAIMRDSQRQSTWED